MGSVADRISWQVRSGAPTQVGDVTITPQSQALTLHWLNWGLVWNRPVAVVVERNGETERIPIVDVTRIAQAALLGWGLAFSLVVFVLRMRQRRDRDGR
jgi:hypothetical protein